MLQGVGIFLPHFAEEDLRNAEFKQCTYDDGVKYFSQVVEPLRHFQRPCVPPPASPGDQKGVTQRQGAMSCGEDKSGTG